MLAAVLLSGIFFGVGFVCGSSRVKQDKNVQASTVKQDKNVQASTSRHIVLFGDSNLYFSEYSTFLGKLWQYVTLPNLPIADYLANHTGLSTIMIPCYKLYVPWETQELVRTLFRTFRGRVDLIMMIGQNDISWFTSQNQSGLNQMKADFSDYLERNFNFLHSMFNFDHLDLRIIHIAPFEDQTVDHHDAYKACFQILYDKISSYKNTLVVGPFDTFLPDRWHLPAEARYKFALQIARAIA